MKKQLLLSLALATLATTEISAPARGAKRTVAPAQVQPRTDQPSKPTSMTVNSVDTLKAAFLNLDAVEAASMALAASEVAKSMATGAALNTSHAYLATKAVLNGGSYTFTPAS